jgi:Fe-S-cluster containining protein
MSPFLHLPILHNGWMQLEIPCEGCGTCCRWPGEVRLDDAEISRLARQQGLAEPVFIERHTRLRQDRRGLALKEQPDGACIFLTASGCGVHAVKPQQCRDFPSLWVNSLWGKVPRAAMERDFPMLFACSAFRNFLKTDRRASVATAEESPRV